MSTTDKKTTPPPPALWKGFVQGAIGAMTGAAVSHPLDLIKVRLQIQGEGVLAAAAKGGGERLGTLGMGVAIFRESGAGGLFRGLSASLFRQFFYSGVRFGVYVVQLVRLGDHG